ncbi:Glycoside hydrolase family 18 protein [Mycena chlorophos]|uniref:Glycoside hydrolase family 18 protein n=1 Tax=Mycena chlorophos TaxID=658473 RepID=A0A8H6SEI9_MYCCL|nr:Glycoside hydrolase family 18 protein [Mycena chlorophos]
MSADCNCSAAVIKGVAHTTASTPRPHIVYTFQLERDGKTEVVKKRFSEFVALHSALGVTDVSLPPKRILVTTFVPSAWVDDALVSERKQGLKAYLNTLLENPTYRCQPALKKFLAPALRVSPRQFDLEDALPSTLSRKQAQEIAETVAATTYIAAAYYPDWSTDQFPPGDLDFSKFDILLFAFATPNSSNTLSWDSGSQSSLQALVAARKASGEGTKIMLSVGGWGGSTYFHQACGSSSARSTFVSALTSAVSTYGLDGIDIDWEYPNEAGAGNPYGSADAANLLTVLTSLRSALGSSKIISCAVTDLPWLGSNGNPLTDVSAYAAQMTYANIMNYDIFGSDFSPAPGPNAPLNNGCGTSSQPQYSAQAAFNQWTAAKFPAKQLLLGLPLYGYVYDSTKTTLSGSFVDPEPQEPTDELGPTRGSNQRPTRKTTSVTKRPPTNGKAAAATANLQSWYGQQIPFSSIVSSGALVKQSNGTYAQGGGFTEGWDNCSDTPFLFNTSQATVVAYDDTYSLTDKATLAKDNGMAGCFTWSLDQDDGTTLQDTIRAALGKST